MLTRVRRLLGLMPAASAPVAPAPVLADELAAAGLSDLEWLAMVRGGGRVYADIDAAVVRTIAAQYRHRAAETIASADRVMRHEFNLLGSGPFVPVDPDRASSGGYSKIDWRLDPVKKVRFPSGVPHKEWNFETMRPAGADIKFPWELGRCQQLVPLGQAYRLTNDDRYALEVFAEIEDFDEANPTGKGVQWTCTMDVAIRAANWTIALALVRACPRVEHARWLGAYNRLFDHCVFMENNLENTYEVTSNHFLSNVAGLYIAASAFPELPSGARWLSRCREWLEQEMHVQVLDDGADYESSIPYHRLVTELFLSGARQASLRGEPLSTAFMARLKTMNGYLADVIRPDGLMPQVGDADDGRLHIFTAYGTWHPQDGRHVLAPAAEMFDVAEWRALAADEAWEAAWWGVDSPGRGDTAPAAPRRPDFRHFPHAGITVLRTSRTYLLISNGIVGTAGFGNHKHNDQLSFEYHVDGVPLVVDPGSGVYTSDPANRNRFRGTASHNTVMIDGVEQNEIRFEWLFRMFETSRPEHVRAESSESALEYEGRHAGYQRLPSPVAHTRRFTLDRASDALSIVDTFDGHGQHALAWHFHCAPGAAPSLKDDGAVEIIAGAVCVRLSVPAGLRVAIEDSLYSPSYGVMRPCRAIALSADVTLDGRIDYAFDFAPESRLQV